MSAFSVGRAFKGLNTGMKAIGMDLGTPIGALGSVPVAGMVGGIAGSLGSAAYNEYNPGKAIDDELDNQIRQAKMRIGQRMRDQRIQTSMAENIMRVASSNPQLYNQLVAGRLLPQGAVLIGGGRRTDFLESVAYQMATGGFGNPQQSTDNSDVVSALI